MKNYIKEVLFGPAIIVCIAPLAALFVWAIILVQDGLYWQGVLVALVAVFLFPLFIRIVYKVGEILL